VVISPAKVAIEKIDRQTATKILSQGKAAVKTAAYCPWYDSRMMGKGKTLGEYADLARAAGASEFMTAPSYPDWGAYWCEKGAYTPVSHNVMVIYDVVHPASPVALPTEPVAPWAPTDKYVNVLQDKM